MGNAAMSCAGLAGVNKRSRPPTPEPLWVRDIEPSDIPWREFIAENDMEKIRTVKVYSDTNK